MISRVRHRGPDDANVVTSGGAGLAHSRLAIIDLQGGRQPMRSDDGSLTITFNGEIFNYIELRQELISSGHRFKTSSDTEVLLRLYQEEGPECVRRLNGQWAFAVWDSLNRRLFLSRDRLGVRPMFYAERDGELLFASEIKALLADPLVSAELDLRALADVFTFWFPLAPRTMFERIQQLQPGHSLLWQDGSVRVWPHWLMDFEPDEEGCHDERYYADALWELLVDSVRLRLRADVPVGAYLSGGLDSSLVTAIIRKHADSQLQTFSISFDDPEFDESRYQNEVAAALETRHQDVHCSASDIADSFPELIWHTETPVLRTAPAPLFLLSRRVHDGGYKVVLTGEGADELLGGYDIFKEVKVRAFCARRPDSRWRRLILRRLYPYLPNLRQQPAALLQAFFSANPEDLSKPFFSHLPRWEMTSKLKLFFSDDTAWELSEYDPYCELQRSLPSHFENWSAFHRAQYLEAIHLLPGYILSSQGDRVAMAHSVEVRLPFLDERVVAFASRIPERFKMKVLNEKYILKRCAAGILPDSVCARHKQPYRAPDGKCFFRPAAPEYVQELLSESSIRGANVFSSTAVEKLCRKFRSGNAASMQDNMALVGILSTQLFIERFVREHRAPYEPIEEVRETNEAYAEHYKHVADVRS